MTSSEGESFSFRSVVPVEGPVEAWMAVVEGEMRHTLAAVMKEGVCLLSGWWCWGARVHSQLLRNSHVCMPACSLTRTHFMHAAAARLCVLRRAPPGVWSYASTPRQKWIADSLGMVTLAGSAVWWTWETEDAFRRVRDGDKHALKGYAAKLTEQLGQLTSMVRADVCCALRCACIVCCAVRAGLAATPSQARCPAEAVRVLRLCVC